MLAPNGSGIRIDGSRKGSAGDLSKVLAGLIGYDRIGTAHPIAMAETEATHWFQKSWMLFESYSTRKCQIESKLVVGP